MQLPLRFRYHSTVGLMAQSFPKHLNWLSSFWILACAVELIPRLSTPISLQSRRPIHFPSPSYSLQIPVAECTQQHPSGTSAYKTKQGIRGTPQSQFWNHLLPFCISSPLKACACVLSISSVWCLVWWAVLWENFWMTNRCQFGQLLRGSSRQKFAGVYELWRIWSWTHLWLSDLCLNDLCWFRNL